MPYINISQLEKRWNFNFKYHFNLLLEKILDFKYHSHVLLYFLLREMIKYQQNSPDTEFSICGSIIWVPLLEVTVICDIGDSLFSFPSARASLFPDSIFFICVYFAYASVIKKYLWNYFLTICSKDNNEFPSTGE